MKTIIIGISLVSLVLSVLGDRSGCQPNQYNTTVCKNGGLITRVVRPASRNNLILDLDGDTTIGPNAFKNVNNWQLKLSFPEKGSPHALFLQPGAFMGITYTTNLDIQHANITFIGNPWAEIGSLTIFRCTDCAFTQVPTDILTSFPNLEELVLKGNYINAVHPNAFASLKNLVILNLARDGAIVLEPGCFNGLAQLEELEILAKSITLVPGVFDGLKKLDTLKLSGDFQNHVTLADIFRAIPTLINFELTDGNVDSLHPGMFDDHLQLRRLSFHNSSIHHIPKNVFNKLDSLVELSFVHNRIATVEPGAFSGMNLSTLVLEFDKELKVIETGTFHGLTVGTLQLSHGEISELKPKAFDGLTANVVSLRDNKLTEIGPDDFFGLETSILDLRQNNAPNIAPGAFTNTKVKNVLL